MEISATINGSEYEFILNPSNSSNGWYGTVEDEHGDVHTIKFTYLEGVISDLEIDQDIQTDAGIILERLINSFRDMTESHQMGFEQEDEILEREEIDPYDPEQIRVRPVVYSAFQINRDIGRKKIDLNPDFQRNFVWNDVQKSRLIESMLLKIPLPAFYFAEDKKGNFQVVDGLQRLTVINQFLNNKFRLKNLQYLSHLDGKYFSIDDEKGITSSQALEEPYDSRVEGTQLNINVIEASSPLRVKYDIFYRINTGGRPLNSQEIRNCFATDRTRRLLKEMAQNELFHKATGYSVKDTRMDAQELALRFCGFLKFRSSYLGDMNAFLDIVLDQLNELPDSDLQDIQIKYYRSLSNAYYLFGNYAFRKVLPDHLRPGARRQFLNKSMFIAWTTLLADVPSNSLRHVEEHSFIEVLANELQQDYDLFNALTTGTTDRYKVDFVFQRFSRLLHMNDLIY